MRRRRTILMPDDAYRFARGEQVTSNTGLPVKLARPYDFYMITDHSDGMGVITDLIAGAPNIMADPDGREMHAAFKQGGKVAMQATQRLISQFAQGTLSPVLNYQPGNPAYARVWGELIQAAEEFNDPNRFTTFAAYEWTSLVKGNNLHRNVIFRDGPERTKRIRALHHHAAQGSPNPQDLWAWFRPTRTRPAARSPPFPITATCPTA